MKLKDKTVIEELQHSERIKREDQPDFTADWPQEKLQVLLSERAQSTTPTISSIQEYRDWQKHRNRK